MRFGAARCLCSQVTTKASAVFTSRRWRPNELQSDVGVRELKRSSGMESTDGSRIRGALKTWPVGWPRSCPIRHSDRALRQGGGIQFFKA